MHHVMLMGDTFCRAEADARRAVESKQTLCDRYQQEAAQSAAALMTQKAEQLRCVKVLLGFHVLPRPLTHAFWFLPSYHFTFTFMHIPYNTHALIT